jgi:hypothetical protein
MLDIFRKNQTGLTDEQMNHINLIKQKAQELCDCFSFNNTDAFPFLPENREFAIAVTKLEECVMWAVKGVTA